MQFHSLLKPFLEPLQANGLRYFVTGSIASIFYGEPRLTHDIDIVLHLSPSEIQKFTDLFPLDLFYCPPVELTKGLSLWIAAPEYVIIRKLEFFREGGAQKHLEDIAKMLPQVADGLDKKFLERELAQRGLGEFWSKIPKV